MQQCGIPSHNTSPVVANQYELIVTKSRSNTGNISCECTNVIIANGRWTVTATIAARIRNGDLKARFHQRVNLMPPQLPALRKPMRQNDQRTFPLDDST